MVTEFSHSRIPCCFFFFLSFFLFLFFNRLQHCRETFKVNRIKSLKFESDSQETKLFFFLGKIFGDRYFMTLNFRFLTVYHFIKNYSSFHLSSFTPGTLSSASATTRCSVGIISLLLFCEFSTLYNTSWQSGQRSWTYNHFRKQTLWK